MDRLSQLVVMEIGSTPMKKSIWTAMYKNIRSNTVKRFKKDQVLEGKKVEKIWEGIR